ncbi:uncharacterized protein LOC144628635 [Oculina patagonica]
MGFKLFILCLTLLAVAVSASTICKCGQEEKPLQDSASDSVEKYKLKLKTEDGKDYDEEVEIDTKKETETFHVPKTATDEKEADIVLDFKKSLMMIRMPEAKSCYLSELTENVPKPADLVRLLDSSKSGVTMAKSRTEEKVKVAGTLDDRSKLNDEMAQLCAKLPIYLVVKVDKAPDMDEPMDSAPVQRTKRGCSFGCKVETVRTCYFSITITITICYNNKRLTCKVRCTG